MDKELFKTIDTIIREERLYSQVNLLREDIMKRFNIGRHNLNDQLNSFADGMSFPQYINSIRMEVAYDLLTNHPEMTIADVAREVGFTAPICANSLSAVMVSPRQNIAPPLFPTTKSNYVRTTESSRYPLPHALWRCCHIGFGIGTLSVAATQ